MKYFGFYFESPHRKCCVWQLGLAWTSGTAVLHVAALRGTVLGSDLAEPRPHDLIREWTRSPEPSTGTEWPRVRLQLPTCCRASSHCAAYGAPGGVATDCRLVFWADCAGLERCCWFHSRLPEHESETRWPLSETLELGSTNHRSGAVVEEPRMPHEQG